MKRKRKRPYYDLVWKSKDKYCYTLAILAYSFIWSKQITQ